MMCEKIGTESNQNKVLVPKTVSSQPFKFWAIVNVGMSKSPVFVINSTCAHGFGGNPFQCTGRIITYFFPACQLGARMCGSPTRPGARFSMPPGISDTRHRPSSASECSFPTGALPR